MFNRFLLTILFAAWSVLAAPRSQRRIATMLLAVAAEAREGQRLEPHLGDALVALAADAVRALFQTQEGLVDLPQRQIALAQRALEGVILADIATAQEALGQVLFDGFDIRLADLVHVIPKGLAGQFVRAGMSLGRTVCRYQ